jgi:hypothetical protein
VPDPRLSSALADVVLVVHVGVAAFVVAGLALVVVGNVRGWRWVNAFAFRVAHLAAIAIVVAEAWFGIACPLTTLEMWLRAQAGGPTYASGFIEHWLQRLLYYDAPPWAFVTAYTAFATIVVATWRYFPPRRPGGPTAT